jgi:Icc-related predicted phosphoesterase
VRIVFTSDCHGKLPEATLPEGDVLVISGDVLQNFTRKRAVDALLQRPALEKLDQFFATLRYRKIVLVAGNHDWVFQLEKDARTLLRHAIYLEDEGCTIDGVTFWGSPWQPEFCDWAFNLPRQGDELRRAWEKIPPKVDVLVTHGPPFGILDRPDGDGRNVGCELLRERVRVVKPRVHAFGHIHGSYGKHHEDGTWFVNASLCDESYKPTQPPIVHEL